MAFYTLISVILLATSATASPLVKERAGNSGIQLSLPLNGVFNKTGGLNALIKSDRARAKAYLERYQAKSTGTSYADTSIPISNVGPALTIEVGVGTPPTTYQLVVDTGSSNTFVGANKQYQLTSSSKDTGKGVKVTYGSGSFQGSEFTDTVSLGSITVGEQSIGVAEQSTGFGTLDGILGLGPADLTVNTVEDTDTVPTVIDNLAQQGKIPQALIGLSILPSGSDSNGGTLDLGTPDSSKFTGDLKFVPITQQNPAKAFWGIDQSISYGSDNTPIMTSTAGIVDSGTTLLFLASDAFQAYVKATGATKDEATTLLKVDSVDTLQSLFFNIGGNEFEFTPNAQIWPRSLNVPLGGDPNSTYLIVTGLGTPSGQGMDFINGFTFLQRFYSVYDTANSQVGFATTPFTNATSN